MSPFYSFHDNILKNVFQIPSWNGSVNTPGSSISITSTTQASNDATSHACGTTTLNATPQANHQWPLETELVLFPGTNKILLTLQSALMHSIFQGTFERLQVSLLFIHAFPDPALTRSMISEALGAATQSHLPRAAIIRNQLELDEEYMSKMCRLVSPSLVTHFEYVLTDILSPMGGFPFSEGRSKSDAQR